MAWLAAHVATAFFGYGCFTVASSLAVSYLVQDYNLKNKHLGHVFERLPSLETTDSVMRHMIAFAFTLFTISVLAGVRLAHIVHWQKTLLTDPKIITVLITWILYAALLVFCAYSRRHGRRIAQITVIGLIFVLFSFLGVHTLTHSTHNFVSSTAESRDK
jgi:ABC-type transport system involved in cytochrome c biogenesis permease subunit